MGPNPLHSGQQSEKEQPPEPEEGHPPPGLSPPSFVRAFGARRALVAVVAVVVGVPGASLASVLAWFPSARPSVPTGLFFST